MLKFPFKKTSNNVKRAKCEIDYNKNKLIGEGGFGKVYMGSYNGGQVAVKVVPNLKGGSVSQCTEEQSLKKLDHPNVIKLLGVEDQGDKRCYAFELCDTSLDRLFTKDGEKMYRGTMPHETEILYQLTKGLLYIHGKQIAHRDIKPENVLICRKWTGKQLTVNVKWADFGLSKPFDVTTGFYVRSGIRGTATWMAPEKLSWDEGKIRVLPLGSYKSDTFSAGCLFFWLLTKGLHPFGKGKFRIAANIVDYKIVHLQELDNQHYAHDAIVRMISKKPDDRMELQPFLLLLRSQLAALANHLQTIGKELEKTGTTRKCEPTSSDRNVAAEAVITQQTDRRWNGDLVSTILFICVVLFIAFFILMQSFVFFPLVLLIFLYGIIHNQQSG